MALTLDDLTVSIRHLDRATLLRDWRWLIGPTKVPVLVTALGNVFVRDTQDDTIHILDAGPGTLQQVAACLEEFRKRLRDRDFVTEHFVPVIVVRMRERGVFLQPGQLYGFKKAPPLGGEYSADNLEPTDIDVHFALLGQIHQRSREEPPAERAVDYLEIIS
jgi:hypothetical protein